MIFFTCLLLSKIFLQKEIQLIGLETIYRKSIAINLLFCSLFFVAWSKGVFCTMREIAYENNLVVRRIGYHLRKLQRVIMINYRRIKFCDFEISWEISNKAKYKHHKGHHITSHFYSKSSRRNPLVINKRPNSKPIIYQAFSSVAF